MIDSDDVTAMSSACKPRAPAAQNGKLQSLPPLHFLSPSLSLCLSLCVFLPLPFIPSLLSQHPHSPPFFYPFFFLSPIPLSFSHTGNMHQLGRKISAGTETITKLNSALCGSAQHNKANTAKAQTCRSTVKL